MGKGRSRCARALDANICSIAPPPTQHSDARMAHNCRPVARACLNRSQTKNSVKATNKKKPDAPYRVIGTKAVLTSTIAKYRGVGMKLHSPEECGQSDG